MTVKKVYIVSFVCMIVLVTVMHAIVLLGYKENNRHIKVGFIYVGDRCDVYTNNFIRAQQAINIEFGDQVEIVSKYNVSEGTEEKYIQELVDEKCDLIFATSFGYSEAVKKYAKLYPDVQFCMATGNNANEEPVLDNYHTFMGEIYEGRYISGVVAGMKMQELLEEGTITKADLKVGYVGAFPYAEVISGYTAFILGVRSVVPEATMKVIYTNSWGNYDIEKKCATKLINEGCVIISQHSDTMGPANACESMKKEHTVYHIGYNQTMSDVAPTTSIISSRINWNYYMLGAVKAVINNKKIENVVEGNVHGNDIGGGLKYGWVQMLKLNDTIAAEGTKEKIEEIEINFKKGKMSVFKGDYIGIDSLNPNDTIDLHTEYKENSESSAPTFHYILKDVVECYSEY